MSTKKHPPQNNASENTHETVEEILSQACEGGLSDTASALVEIYESVERSYRAAILTGEAIPNLSQSTNY